MFQGISHLDYSGWDTCTSKSKGTLIFTLRSQVSLVYASQQISQQD
jgi:hypothetical protein